MIFHQLSAYEFQQRLPHSWSEFRKRAVSETLESVSRGDDNCVHRVILILGDCYPGILNILAQTLGLPINDVYRHSTYNRDVAIVLLGIIVTYDMFTVTA